MPLCIASFSGNFEIRHRNGLKPVFSQQLRESLRESGWISGIAIYGAMNARMVARFLSSD